MRTEVRKSSPRWFARRIAKSQGIFVGQARIRGWNRRRTQQMTRAEQLQVNQSGIIASLLAMFGRARRTPNSRIKTKP